MTIANPYRQAVVIDGTTVHSRIVRAGWLFSRHLGTARRLLDIGCGAGEGTAYLQRLLGAVEAHGVDILEDGITLARRKGIHGVLLDADGAALPFPDGYFEAVFIGDTIEVFRDTDRVLDEAHRVLAPGGLLVCGTANLAAWFNRIALPLGYQPFPVEVSYVHSPGRPRSVAAKLGGSPMFRVFTLRALVDLLRIHEFTIVGVVGDRLPSLPTRPKLPFSLAVLNMIDGWCARIPALSARVIVAATPKR
jgi:SAM-dependent methyltransferase